MNAKAVMLIAVVLLVSRNTYAQHVQSCDASWYDEARLRAIIQVELGEPSDLNRVEIGPCEADSVILALREDLDAPPTSLASTRVDMSAIEPRARGRYVALVLAEMLRTQHRTPAPASQPLASESEPRPAETPPEVSPEPRAVVATTAGDARPSEPQSRPPVATARVAPESAQQDGAEALGEPVRSTRAREWFLTGRAYGRLYFNTFTTAAVGELQLKYDRLLLHISGAGTQIGRPDSTLRIAQFTTGAGVRILEHRGNVRLGWDARGDIGVLIMGGETTNASFVGSTNTTYALSASTQFEMIWPLGPIEFGANTDFGFQRGAVDVSELDVARGFAHFFLSVGLTLSGPLS